MAVYTPPLRDMEFALAELAGLDDLATLPGYEEATPELVASVLEEAGRIAANVVAPLNQTGDRQGVRLENGAVVTADGWKDAYRTLVDGNWIGLAADPRWGGMGLPGLVAMAVGEMWDSANMAFGLWPLLTQGAIHAIEACAAEEQKALYLPRLVSGEWTGTMNLTEPAAGSDLGAVRTKAVPNGDHYLISGQKIFITYGEHDMAENIVHLVLARTPTAPPGVKGISLFIVPKFLVAADGSLGPRNDVHCIALEHKLGIHASPTCVMAYGDAGGAVGHLVGEENRGLEYMFVMMNNARLTVGREGLAIAERAYQQALSYARERVQGKPLGFAQPAPIVEHPDVRRLLMTMKSHVEAMRALVYVEAAALDRASRHPDPAARVAAKAYAEFLTPVVKGWCTERGFDVTSMGVQVHGGMGFMEETGACQHLRDARITPIYEGTTAIQGNDLINRKILRDQGATARAVLAEAAALATELGASGDEALAAIGAELAPAVEAALAAIAWVIEAAPKDPRLPAAAAVPLIDLLGLVLGAHQLAKGARAARAHIDGGQGDSGFHQAKLDTARFFATGLLPEAASLRARIVRGSGSVMSVPADRL